MPVSFRRPLLVTTLLAACAPLAALAQYSGPTSAGTAQSVAEVLKNPRDDQQVVLRGVLTSQVGKEKYLFSDGTGEIRVEIDDHDFRGLKVDEKTAIEIRGEVEKDFLESPEIDVDVVLGLFGPENEKLRSK